MSVIIVGFRIPSFSVAGNQYLRRHALRRILSPPLSGPLKSKCNARPEVIEAKSQQRIPGLISLHQARGERQSFPLQRTNSGCGTGTRTQLPSGSSTASKPQIVPGAELIVSLELARHACATAHCCKSAATE